MRHPLTDVQVEYILNELCTKSGFCLPENRREWLKSKPPVDIDTFADAVMRAEGLDPATHRELRKGVVTLIAKYWKDDEDNGSTDCPMNWSLGNELDS